MKGRFLIFVFFSLFFVTFACLTNISLADEVTITGKVLPVDWDDDDNVIAVVIVDDDGEEYLVLKNANGKKLLKLVDKYVSATGTIGEDSEGDKTIAVTYFEMSEE